VNIMLLADSFTQFLPPLTPLALLALLAALLVGGLGLGWLLGAANVVARRWSLWALRSVVLAVVWAILLNPVRVDEASGPVERPEMFYLLDTSSSMQIGNPRSRWDEAPRTHRRCPASRRVVARAGQSPFVFLVSDWLRVEQGDLLGLLADRGGKKGRSPSVHRGSQCSQASQRAAASCGRPTATPGCSPPCGQISSRFGACRRPGIVVFSRWPGSRRRQPGHNLPSSLPGSKCQCMWPP